MASKTQSSRPDPRTWGSFSNPALRRVLHDISACQVNLDAVTASIAHKRELMATYAALKADAGSDAMRDRYARDIGSVLQGLDLAEREQDAWQVSIDNLWARYDELTIINHRIAAE